LDLNDLDLLFHELTATATEEPAAVMALRVAIQATVLRLADDGIDKSKIRFILGKVLFDITRNILVTKSSDIFVLLLRLAVHFLREIVTTSPIDS
jgi:hypothetical protein